MKKVFTLSTICITALLMSITSTAQATFTPIKTGTSSMVVAPFYFNSPSEIDVNKSGFKKTFNGKNKEALNNWVPLVTNNKMKLDVSILSPIKINADPAACDISNWQEQVKAQVRAKTHKTHDFYAFYYNKAMANCGFAAVVQLSDLHTITFNDNFNNVINHEFGHSLGLLHACGYNCKTSNGGINVNDCTSNEYGDSFDIMGGAYYYPGQVLNSYERLKLGIIKRGQIVNATGDGVYSVNSSTTVNKNKLTIRVPRQPEPGYVNYNDNYFLDYRNFPGISGFGGNGILVNIGSDPFVDTGMKDTSGVLAPFFKPACWRNAPLLKLGEVMIDNYNRLLISMVKADGRVAKVRIKHYAPGVDPNSLITKKGSRCYINK